MDNRQDITDDEMAARLVDVEETQDIEVVGAHGATITTLTESGSDYCRHDPSVICGVDGVATEAEWCAALRQILDTWLIIAAAVRSAVNEKVISEHLAGQGPEWRADALDSRYHVATVDGYPLVRLAADDRVVRLDCAETREEMAEGLADLPYDEYGVDWDENATDSYVQRTYGDDGDSPGDITVRIGLDPTTHFWWIDEGDDAEREHYGPYATRAEAEAKMAECLAKDESAEEVQ